MPESPHQDARVAKPDQQEDWLACKDEEVSQQAAHGEEGRPCAIGSGIVEQSQHGPQHQWSGRWEQSRPNSEAYSDGLTAPEIQERRKGVAYDWGKSHHYQAHP